MKKLSLILVVCMILCALTSVAMGETYTLQLGHAQSTTSARHQSCLLFEKLVEEQTNGDIQVEIFPAGQLGNETEMTEAVAMGILQAVRGGD